MMAHFQRREAWMRHATITANTITEKGIKMRATGMSGTATTPKRRIRNAGRGPPFDTQSLLAAVGAQRCSADYEPKEAIFQQGDIADTVFSIEAGTIQITALSDQGKEGVVAMRGAGDFFGEGCLAGQTVQMASATAQTRSKITRIEKAA